MAAPTYDNSASTSSASNVASLTTASWAIGGSDRYLVGGIGSSAGTVVNPSAMKWGGSGGTDLTKQGTTLDVNVNAKLSCYTLLAPAASTTTLYGSWPSNQDETWIGGVSVSGVDQTTPIGTVASAVTHSSAPTVNATTTADDFVVDIAMIFDNNFTSGTIAVGAGQTQRINNNVSTNDAFGMSTEAATGTSTTMSWSVTGTSNYDAGIFAVPLKPVSGGGGPTTEQVATAIAMQTASGGMAGLRWI